MNECWKVKDLIAYLQKLDPEMEVEFEGCDFYERWLEVHNKLDGTQRLYIGV